MINVEGVLNPLSFGWITFGILKQLRKSNVDFNFAPISNNIDWSTFDKVDENFKNYTNSSFNDFNKRFNINDKSFRVWHVNGSHQKLSKTQNSLLTFHELDSLTDEEVNILNSFDNVFVTSNFSKNIFEDFGVKSKVIYAPLGIDTDVFFSLNQPRPFKDIIVFSIFGKWEKRKRTTQTIQAWISKYGNNHKYKLHCYITNPFFKPEQMNAIYSQIFNNQNKPFNVDLFPYLPNNSVLNSAYNSTDIVLDMSGGESISLPSLNCVAMGKHAVVHYNSAIRDWANEENSILVKSNGKEPVYDGIFFHPNSKFNCGNIYTYNNDDFINGCELAIKRFESKQVNEKGKELVKSYSFENGTNIILKEIDKYENKCKCGN